MHNSCGNTVAMKLAFEGVIPPKEWRHDPNLKNDNRDTVASILTFHGIAVP